MPKMGLFLLLQEVNRFIREVSEQTIHSGFVIQNVIKLIHIRRVGWQLVGPHGIRMHHQIVMLSIFYHPVS